MNRPLRITLIVAGLLALLVLLLPLLVPLSVYRGRLEAEFSAAAGRPVRIEGPLKLTIFPDLGFRAEQVVISNLPGGQAPYLARAESLRVQVRLRPLLGGRVEISEVVLDHPDLRLEVDSKGRANWNIAPPDAQPSWLVDQTKMSVAEVKIQNGSARYEDARSNGREDVEDIDATLDWFGRTLALDGELTNAGERLAFVAKAADPGALLNGRASHVDLSLTSDIVQGSFKGTLAFNGAATGMLKFDTPSLRKLVAWRGSGLPNVGGLGLFSLQAKLNREGALYRLDAARITLGETEITGDLQIDSADPVPALRGTLKLDHFNVGPYIVPPDSKAFTRADIWDSAPFDLSLLKLFDSALSLEIGRLDIRALSLADVKLFLGLQGNRLEARFDNFALQGGSGHMNVQADVSGPVPVFQTRLYLQRVAARPFLSALFGISGLEGTATLSLDLSSRGDSVAAVMRGLAGRGNFSLANGRIRGADLELAGRTARLGVPEAAKNAKAATMVGTMRGSFSASHGVLTTEDFGLSNPILEMLGGGTVNFGARRLDILLKPRARLEMDERPLNTIGDFSAPFRLGGAWNRLTYKPEPASPR